MRSMKYNPKDMIFNRDLTDDLIRNFQSFCDNVKKSNKFVGTIMISESSMTEDDNAFFKVPNDSDSVYITRVQEALFQINAGLLRYVAYHPADPEKMGLFICTSPPVFMRRLALLLKKAGLRKRL